MLTLLISALHSLAYFHVVQPSLFLFSLSYFCVFRLCLFPLSLAFLISIPFSLGAALRLRLVQPNSTHCFCAFLGNEWVNAECCQYKSWCMPPINDVGEPHKYVMQKSSCSAPVQNANGKHRLKASNCAVSSTSNCWVNSNASMTAAAFICTTCGCVSR